MDTDYTEANAIVDSVVEHSTRIGVQEGLEQYLTNKRIFLTPFRHVPRELFGVMDIIVPGDGDRENEEAVRMVATEETIKAFRDVYMPDIMSIRSTIMNTPELIAAAHNYVNAYAQYVSEQYTTAEAHYDDAEARLDYVENALTIELEPFFSKTTDRRAFIRQHPAVVGLEREKRVWGGLKKRTYQIGQRLSRKIKEISRLVSTLEKQLEIEGSIQAKSVEHYPNTSELMKKRTANRRRSRG